ncbi:MAG: GNAT family N-acetyltransferase [Microcoleaceae cyanobacterium]
MVDWPIPGYKLRTGSSLDRALLLKFMNRTYQELYPGRTFSHFSQTIEQHLSSQTPLWWTESVVTRPEVLGTIKEPDAALDYSKQKTGFTSPFRALFLNIPIACLWLGNAIDQVEGDRIAYIFLLYVDPQHRRRGIGSALMQQAEYWARQRGDRKISLQVFSQNQPALNLYQKQGYQVQSLTLQKSLQQF